MEERPYDLRVVGIDPGSVTTGYGMIDTVRGNPIHVVDGVIKTPLSSTLAERLSVIFRGIRHIITEYHPDVMAVEDIFFAMNVKSAVKLGHARGIALLSAAEAGIPVYEYSPTKVKQAVVGYGRATKFQVQNMIKTILDIQYLPKSDAADALAVAICHMNTRV